MRKTAIFRWFSRSSSQAARSRGSYLWVQVDLHPGRSRMATIEHARRIDRLCAHKRPRARPGAVYEGTAEVTPAMPTPACDSHLNHRDGSLGGPWGGCRRRPNSFRRERAHFVAKNVFPWSLRSKRKRAHAAPTALSTKLRCFVRLLHSLDAPEADRLDAVAAIPQPTPASGPYGRLREDGTNCGDGHPWPETRARSGPVIVPGPWA